MWWNYLLVFVGALLFDILPFPFLPAFTIMVFLQIMFHLNIWLVIVIGVMGSILGRYILTLYIPFIAGKIFKPSKNEDVQFLGKKMKEKGWKSQAVIVCYSLLPLPTTPLFLAGGMAKIRALYIIPSFFVGKFVSDSIAVHAGRYASENAHNLMDGAFSWKSIASLVIGLFFLFALLFIDWRTLIQKKKFQLNFKIWK
jgi:membrane protein YqaA with SNARE-associated domain